MRNYDLSILIPARNEMFLASTVENILKNIRGNTEVLVALDGAWANPGIPDAENVTVVYFKDPLGQRAATNQLARLSTAKYLMKIDAHCVIDEGMDVKMLEAIKGHDNWTMVPILYNLHAFDWLCENGHRIYQGPTPAKCLQCGKPMHRDIKLQPRWSRRSTYYRFDHTLHFKYWGSFESRPEAQGDVAPSLSLQGSLFMLTRERWWALEICDERHGSWGQQGTEVAIKTWLSGGQVMVNKKTWYSHLFRTQGGDFGFPFPLAGADIDKARKYSRELFLEDKWDNPNKIHNLQWLLDKFKPIPDWHTPEETGGKPSKGIVYYTHGVGDPAVLDACRRQIRRGMKEKHIVSVSLVQLKFGKNIVMQRKPGYLTMAHQILAGLEASTAQVIFFCEHDVLYHPSHFNFIPLRHDVVYYNTNVWRVRYEDGHALFCNDLRQLSGLVAYRDILITHYKKRVEMLEAQWAKDPDDKRFGSYVRQMGFEPGTHGRAERVDDLSSDVYQSQFPNLDIRTETTLTPSRWRKDQFVNQRFTEGWTESDEVPGWGVTKNRVPEIIASIR